MTDLSPLINQTISKIEWVPISTPAHYDEPFDDGDMLKIHFTSGATLLLSGNYHEEYTGKSVGEYPSYLSCNITLPYIRTDSIVDQVISKFQQRSATGIAKYGTTLEENNNDDFLKHLQEELMDAVLYIEKLKTITHE